MLGPKGRQIRIISKVENQEGIQNFDQILEKSDAIMVRHAAAAFTQRRPLRALPLCSRVSVCQVNG